MCHRISFCLVISAIAFIFISPCDVFAQYCIGTTRYVVRDADGKILTDENQKKLTVKSINGIPLKFNPTPDEYGFHYYSAEFVRGKYRNNIAKEFRRETETSLLRMNPLVFGTYRPTYCGEIGDLTLEHGGKEMRLIFDIGEHNTRYEIDSLPFQEGTFYRTSLKCADGAKPPLIDNNNVGKCQVSADTWKKADKDWVRPLRWAKRFWFSPKSVSDGCSDRKITVVGNHKDWVAAWEFYLGLNKNNSLPEIDFKTEAVLIVRQPYGSSPPGYDSAWVNMKGDLMFRPLSPPDKLTPGECNIYLLRIYRSGIKTVEGKPLPPPSQDLF